MTTIPDNLEYAKVKIDGIDCFLSARKTEIEDSDDCGVVVNMAGVEVVLYPRRVRVGRIAEDIVYEGTTDSDAFIEYVAPAVKSTARTGDGIELRFLVETNEGLEFTFKRGSER